MRYKDGIERENLKLEGIQAVAWHSIGTEKAYSKLYTDPNGLEEKEAGIRLDEFGENSLPPKEPPSMTEIFLHQFKSPLIYILIFAGFIALLINEITDAAFILGIIMLNSVLGTYQEYNAEKSAASLQNMIKLQAKVRRNGREQTISSRDIVPGDIVMLESGDRVPADMLLTEINNISVDESFLTGESRPVLKTSGALDKDTPLADRLNVLYAGSTVVSGRGTGIVYKTGLNTEVGQIASSVNLSEPAKPPLVIRMEKFSRNISFAVIGACLILSVIAVSRNMPFADIVFMAVALAVSAIPEGLPVALTVALSIGTKRMADRNVIVRKLTAVEGLGSCTYIASDKTGTLTLNKQLVRIAVLPDEKAFTITGDEISGEGEILGEDSLKPDARESSLILRIAEAVSVTNEASLYKKEGNWAYSGDAVDAALLAFSVKAGLEPDKIKRRIKIISDIPYESENRLSATLYSRDGRVYTAVKGASEAVIPFCEQIIDKNGKRSIERDKMMGIADNLASEGYRVLAVAYSEHGPEERDMDFNIKNLGRLTLAGFIGMIDPLRSDAAQAVMEAYGAGVIVSMVTGDHPATALAIAKKIGIADNYEDVVTGAELDRIGPPEVPEFFERVKHARVFARVTPMQKLEIVEALLRLGHFVAVTGDGINDAPALKRASIGVAMGSGTEVTKETASIIITDDKFSSIVSGIEEGRIAYDNVRKVIYLLLSTGTAEILLFILAMIFNHPLPLLAVQILWLNLVTNGIQDIALAFEKGEKDIMLRKPKRPDEGIFNIPMIKQVLISGFSMGFIAFFAWDYLLRTGYNEAYSRSLVLMLMVLMQNIHLFNCRSESSSAFRVPLSNNYILLAGLLAAQTIHVLSTRIPFMQNLLGIEAIRFYEWLNLLLLSFLLLAIMELYKLADHIIKKA